jgi:SRSO17 transposase
MEPQPYAVVALIGHVRDIIVDVASMEPQPYAVVAPFSSMTAESTTWLQWSHSLTLWWHTVSESESSMPRMLQWSHSLTLWWHCLLHSL